MAGIQCFSSALDYRFCPYYWGWTYDVTHAGQVPCHRNTPLQQPFQRLPFLDGEDKYLQSKGLFCHLEQQVPVSSFIKVLNGSE